MAAQQVATNLDEESPAIQQIQDTMEAFNRRWNNIASSLNNKIRLVSCLLLFTCKLKCIEEYHLCPGLQECIDISLALSHKMCVEEVESTAVSRFQLIHMRNCIAEVGTELSQTLIL